MNGPHFNGRLLTRTRNQENNEPVMILRLLKSHWPFVIGAALGAAVGYYGQCQSGTCVFSSTWWGGAITGTLLAGLVAGTYRPSP